MAAFKDPLARETLINQVLSAPRQPLISSDKRGGLSGETFLSVVGNSKYVVRQCCNEGAAAQFWELCLMPELVNRGFVPLIHGTRGNELVVEYVEGRDMKREDASDLQVARDIGSACAIVNTITLKQLVPRVPTLNANSRFNSRLNELLHGASQIPTEYTAKACRASTLRTCSETPDFVDGVIDNDTAEDFLKLHELLWSKANPQISWDMADCIPSNWRIREIAPKSLCFVDLEGVRVDIKVFFFLPLVLLSL